MASQSPPAAPNSPAFFIPWPSLGSMFLHRHKTNIKLNSKELTSLMIWPLSLWFPNTKSSHNGANLFCFLSSLTLPDFSSLLTNHCIAGVGLPNHMMGEVLWKPKEDDRRTLSIQSFLVRHVHVPAIRFGRFHTVCTWTVT
jgi:hypothetical protein